MHDDNSPNPFLLALVWGIFILILANLFKGYSNTVATDELKATYDLGENNELIINATYQGHFIIPGTINSKPVNFILDTGATNITLPWSIARESNLPVLNEFYAHTANGNALVYSSNIENLTIGEFKFNNIDVVISPQMSGNLCLLGMNILKELDINIQDNKLILSSPD